MPFYSLISRGSQASTTARGSAWYCACVLSYPRLQACLLISAKPDKKEELFGGIFIIFTKKPVTM